MKFGTYELEIFDELLHGQLSPKNVLPKQANAITDYLEESYDQAYLLSLVNYSKSDDKIIIDEVRNITNAHPLADQYFSFENGFGTVSTCSIDIPKVLRKLKITDDIIQIVAKEENSITITQQIDWDSLDESRLKYCYYSTLLKNEIAKLYRRIRTNIFQSKDTLQAEFYIRKLQYEINNHSQDLIKKNRLKQDHLCFSVKEQYSNQDIYALIYMHLETVLCFIETNYLHYIDKTAKIPYNSELVDSYDLSSKVRIISESLTSAKLSWKFMTVLIEPLRKATGITLLNRISYNELSYLNSLINILHSYCAQNEITESKLSKLLLELNFNHPDFFKYLKSKIKMKLRECATEDEKRIVLYKQLKSLQQTPVRIKLVFNDKFETLKYDLINWVSEELHYLEKKSVQLSALPQSSLDPDQLTKLTSDLSVAQLALLFKLLSESGVITNNNQQEILKSVAHNFSSSKSKNISINSLQNKYYNHDSGTIQTVRFKLIEMLNSLQNK